MEEIDSINCVTHHYACDCRELKFAAIETENARLKAELEKERNSRRAFQDLVAEVGTFWDISREDIAKQLTRIAEALERNQKDSAMKMQCPKCEGWSSVWKTFTDTWYWKCNGCSLEIKADTLVEMSKKARELKE